MRVLAIGLAVLPLVGCGSRSGGSGSGAEGASTTRQVVQNKGSDTLVNVAQSWAEHYKTVNPNVAIAVSGGGTGTGISALINGTVDIANCSRKIEPGEIEQAKANGVEPVEFIVGYDALAVYVHKDNPIQGLTLAQLGAIYGEGGDVDDWSDLGVQVPGATSSKIVLVSRQNNSGTYAYFKEAVLGKEREYRLGSLDMHGSKDVVDLVLKTPGAIGYSGLAYATPEVKLVPVAAREGEPFVMPTVESAVDGSYPIARPLFMYTRGQPTGVVKEYMDWILSEEGQRIIQDKGYAPVRAHSTT
jgi:phosphate transport system substrate-binding protein